MKVLESVELLQARSNDEILALAKKIEAKNRAEREAKELERFERVKDLICTVESLRPDKSDSVINDLLKIAKAKDFRAYFVFWSEYKGRTFENYAKYDGVNLTIQKENGTTPVRSLPFKSFVKYHLCDFTSFLKCKSISERNSKGFTAQEMFETYEAGIVGDYADKGSNVIDTNKGTIYKNKLQNKGLELRNKENKKAEAQAQKAAKIAAKKKKALAKIEALQKSLSKLG